MPAQYTPTGRPPGRPKKNPDSKPEAIPQPRDVRALMRETAVDFRSRPLDAICGGCFPDGWDKQELRIASCPHGMWVKRS